VGPLKALASAVSLAILAASGARGAEGARAGTAARPIGWEVVRWSREIDEASLRFGIPGEWIRRVMRAESGGRTSVDGRPLTSSAGAMGLMQLMPGTWADMRDLHGLGQDPHDPRDNILAGTAYLRALYDRFGYPGLFAAYHAGPARYAAHLATGRRLPAETVAYLVATAQAAAPGAAAAPARAPAGLFVRLASAPAAKRGSPSSAAAGDRLFVPIRRTSEASE
jgi:soluble lytic murein transglycosylase-like protein